MTIEIRELVIKTEIKSLPEEGIRLDEETIKLMKSKILSECRQLIKSQNQKSSFNR